jgi:hypothetical protein
VVLGFTRILHVASVAICAITIASFALFAINQTGTASANQQKVLNGEAPAPSVAGEPNAAGEAMPGTFGLHRSGSRPARGEHVGSVHKAIDEASNALTSPVAGVVSGSSSEWTKRTVRLLLALAIYGFGLGFVARTLRVHA